MQVNRTVKGMVVAGVLTTCLWGGFSIYDLNNKLDDATKTVNRLEQKVESKNAEINSLQSKYNELDGSHKSLQKINDAYEKTINQLKQEKDSLINRIKDLESNYINVKASAYIATCSEGCSGTTASGEDVTDSIYVDGMRVIATDTSVIPMGSIVELHFKDGTVETAIALDTGGAIKGNKIDLLVGSTSEGFQFGRQDVTVHVIEWG